MAGDRLMLVVSIVEFCSQSQRVLVEVVALGRDRG